MVFAIGLILIVILIYLLGIVDILNDILWLLTEGGNRNGKEQVREPEDHAGRNDL